MSNLKNYYQSLPSEKKSEKKVFIEKIAEKTGKDTSTVYRWINGDTEPSLLEKKEMPKLHANLLKNYLIRLNMLKLVNFEFYRTPEGAIMAKEANKPVFEYKLEHKWLTREIYNHIKDFYTKAFDALCSLYSKSNFHNDLFEYRVVHRFLRCNFGNYDRVNDIDQFGEIHMENVDCPLAGECKQYNVVCNPQLNRKLTATERQVMELTYKQLSVDEIADVLFISPETVKKHISNSLKRLKLKNQKEFFKYAAINNLFNK